MSHNERDHPKSGRRSGALDLCALDAEYESDQYCDERVDSTGFRITITDVSDREDQEQPPASREYSEVDAA